MTRKYTWRLIRPAIPLVAAALLFGAWPEAASPQPAATALFQKAQALDKAAREAASPPLKDLRVVRVAYEAVPRTYPKNTYCDDALMAGAEIAALAYERYKDAYDLQQSQKLFEWLIKEYPTSDFVKPAQARLKQVKSPQPADTKAAPPPVTPPAKGDAPKATPPPAKADAPKATPPAATPPAASTSATRPAVSPAPVAPPAPPPTGAVSAHAVKSSTLPTGDRVTIELDREVRFTTARVTGPDRLFVDIQNATFPAAIADRAQSITGALISTVKVVTPPDGTTRLVIELTGTPRHSIFVLYEPFRLNIDLERPGVPLAPAPTPPAETVAPDTAPPPAPPETTSTGGYSLARQLGLGVSRIVIDPGHGGHDPGAQANGVSEAELVLDVALRLEKLLQQDKANRVVLTRRTDTFVPLEDRTARANQEHADLFVSIHANANAEAVIHGVETYYLNFASNPAAQAVAARENATSSQNMGSLADILKAIAMNNKLAESRELAGMVQSSMTKRLTVQNASLKDLGVKQAPFVVLIGAQMPSVLAEVSFVTNKTDATLLKQATYRQRIAQSLYDAIVKYQASLKRVNSTVAGKGLSW